MRAEHGGLRETAVRCRAAENTVYFASVNCDSEGVPITSAVAAPDGRLVCWQPHGVPGLLVADLTMRSWSPSVVRDAAFA